MAFRHVEALIEAGFDGRVALGGDSIVPRWFGHDVPTIGEQDIEPEDCLVLPEDDLELLRRLAALGCREVIFVQNHIYAAGYGVANLADR